MGSAACGSDEPPPVTAARAFARAAQAGDVETLLTMVDAQTAARVGHAAERASDQVGGRRNVEPQEMLQVVDVDPRFQVAAAELRSGDDQRAEVQLTGSDGRTHSLELINEEGAWRVRPPLPPGPVSEP
ncbi:MAG: hypothetical protein KDK70_09020 [Myxococcales bacterium]|nr:hypothetical protein [Myxococcales bacterium]